MEPRRDPHAAWRPGGPCRLARLPLALRPLARHAGARSVLARFPLALRRLPLLAGALLILCVGGMASWAVPAQAADPLRPTVDLLVGVPLNANGPLHIEQAGQADLDLTAHWRTRPFESPFYYVARVALGSARDAWALDLMHHKLYLDNNPPQVQSFTLTHGYNLLTVQRLWRRGPWQAVAGAGAAIPHVENTVRGRRYPENRGLFGAGYHLAGPAFLGGIGRRLPLAGPIQLSLEVRGTLSWAWVDVAGGQASLTHAGLHALAGLAFAPR